MSYLGFTEFRYKNYNECKNVKIILLHSVTDIELYIRVIFTFVSQDF